MINLETIKKRLENHSPIKLIDNESVKGAVMVPIFVKDNDLYMLFTKRTEELSSHKGQISFPGGKQDPNDKSLIDCAFRETYEEIGLNKNKIKLIGELDQIKTFGSNILLTPFVCEVISPFTLKINKNEVAEVIEVPLNQLFKEEKWEVRNIKIADIKERNIFYFHYKKWVIWGATARIVKQFISLF